MMVRRLASIPVLLVVVISVSLLTAIVLWVHQSEPREMIDPRCRRFMQLVADGRKAEALELGNSLYYALLQEKPDDAAFILPASRLEAAKQIKTRVADRIQPSQTISVEAIGGMDDLGLLSQDVHDKNATDVLLPPAQNLYWNYLRVFAATPTSNRAATQQTTFCDQYYDLCMRDLIMEIGRHVIMADSDSSEYICYAIILPLLYLHGRDNAWDQMEPLLVLFSPETLDILSNFALLQIERPQAAMALARYKVTAVGKEFYPILWASDAAHACVQNHRPDLAEEVLRLMISDTKDGSEATQLQLRIADGYGQCADYAAAAQRARQIIDDFPNTTIYGKIKATHLGYLAKDGQAEQLVAESESALQDTRCRSQLAQILYLRWWALCKVNRQDEAAKLAQQLIEQFPGNPCVAPILLERATDALAHQQYDRCRELLTTLTTSFPGTESAKRAQEILARLKDSQSK